VIAPVSTDPTIPQPARFSAKTAYALPARDRTISNTTGPPPGGPFYLFPNLSSQQRRIVVLIQFAPNCSRKPSTPCSSMALKVTPSIPGAPSFSLASVYASRSVSILQTWTYNPQKRQDFSAFAFRYILLLHHPPRTGRVKAGRVVGKISSWSSAAPPSCLFIYRAEFPALAPLHRPASPAHAAASTQAAAHMPAAARHRAEAARWTATQSRFPSPRTIAIKPAHHGPSSSSGSPGKRRYFLLFLPGDLTNASSSKAMTSR
jgi:hypothetical protein